MAKRASARAGETTVPIHLPKKLSGKKVILMDAEEYARLKKRLAEIEDALGKISRGNAAYRDGRAKTVRSLSELSR